MTAPVSPAERLERLARKPLAPHRHELRMLAERLRALEAYEYGQEAPELAQLDLLGAVA